MTFHEFEQLIQEYNEKHTEFHIEDEEYHGNFTRPVLNSRNICIGHIKKVFPDSTLILRSYSSLPEIKEEILNFLEDFKFKTLFFVPCGKSQLNVYVAKIEGLK
jgi:alpha-mannosidase